MKLIDGVTGPIKAVSAAIDQANKKIEATKARADKAFQSAANIKHAADGVRNFANKMSDSILDVVKQASDFEQAMLGVAKQVQGARDPSGKLTEVYADMAKQIQALGREMPLATNEIANMVAAGARMNIPKDELIEFTKLAGTMAEAFQLPAAELADNMGKIKVLFGIKTQDELRGLADSINWLDDNAISKGGEMIQFLQRAGSVAGAIKITGKEMTAIGSTLLTLGDHSMRAGTSINAMFSLFAAADKGKGHFKDAMAEIGLSLKDVQKGMQVDAQGTFLTIIDAINKMPKQNRIGVMVDLVGMDHSDTLAKIVSGVDEYRRQIGLVHAEQAKGSMDREYQAKLATTAAQWEITKNRATELAVNIGSVLLPEINKLLAVLGPIASKTADWAKEHPGLVKALGITAFAVTGLAFALGGLMTTIGILLSVKGIGLLVSAFGITLPTAIFSGLIPALSGAAAGLWAVVAPALVAAAPFIAIAAAVAAVTLGLLQLIRLAREWDSIDFGAVWKGIDAAIGDQSFWKTLTLNPFSGLSGGGGGLQPVLGAAVASAAGSGPLSPMSTPAGELVIKFDENNRPQVSSMKSSGLDLEVQSTTGRMMK